MAISSSDIKFFGNSFSNIKFSEISKITSPAGRSKSKLIGPEKDIIEIKHSVCTPKKEVNNTLYQRLPKYCGEALEVSIPHEVKPTEITKIQRGELGIIRSKEELTPKDIVKIVKYQQENITPEKIEKILSQFNEEDRSIAEELFIRMTQFANYDSLEEITRQTSNGILEDRLTGLGSTIRYLAKHKGAFRQEPKFVNEKGSFIVDEIFLKRIESDKEYLKKILEKNPEFIIPEGFTNGINIFNQTQDIESVLKGLFKSTKSIKKKYPNLSDSEAISVALNMPVINRLKEAGIKTKPKVIKNQTITSNNKPKTELIAEQLNGKFLSEEIITAILEKYPPEQRQYALEILAQTFNTKTTKTLSQRLEQIHKTLLSLNNGTDEGVYYIIPQDVKSYTLITTQYQITNGIHPSKIIRRTDIASKLPDDAKKLVILDDLAGSGQSLEVDYGAIVDQLEQRQGNKVEDIFLAPILSTPEALKKLSSIGIGKYRCTCIPTELTSGITRSEYFTSLTKEEQILYKNLLGGNGFEGGCLSVAFPYMAPDNNSKFFSNNFASFFTLNGSGVKGKAKL